MHSQLAQGSFVDDTDDIRPSATFRQRAMIHPLNVSRRPRSARGMTLIELTVATTIATIIVAAAMTSVATLNRFIFDAQRTSSLDGEAKLLVEYLVSSAQGVGGGAFRPWSVVAVEDDWGALPGDDSDRVILANLDDSFSECTILGAPGGSVLDFDPAACCLSPAWAGRQVMLTGANGRININAAIGSVTISPGTCQAVFPGAFAGGVASANLNALPGAMSEFVGGAMAVVDVTRVWFDAPRNVLVMDKDTDGDGTFEQIDLSEGVYDFQVSLGYDVDRSGHLTDTGSNADEWLFNSGGEAMGAGAFASAAGPDLRMVSFGVIMGEGSRISESPGQVLNGTQKAVAGMQLRGTIGRAMFRNLALFDL